MPGQRRPLRVAMAGAGFASAMHLAGWARVAEAQVVALCDPDADKARRRAAEFGVASVFTDAAEMLDATSPDALDVVASLPAHVPLCRLAASRGVHVMCQKPLAGSVAEGRALEREIDARVRVMVHENWRFRPQYRTLRGWLDEGLAGEPVSCHLLVRASGLLADPQGVRPQLLRQPFVAGLPRFMIGELLVHHLDLLRWLLGPLQVVDVTIARRCPAIRGEDFACIALRGRGVSVVLEGNYSVPGVPPTPHDRLEIVGSAGVLRFEHGLATAEGRHERSERFDLDRAYADSYHGAIAHFAAALAAGTSFETGLEDHLRTLELVERCYALAVSLDP